MESPSRRRVETPRPEAGLAEWTNKIKALQRDVDADGEAEQRKLEDEIRASRLARSRRSGGMQFTGKVPLNASPDDRGSNPAEALRKLTGEPTSPSHTTPVTSYAAERKPAPSPAATKPEPMSLAAFMGGKATGPRLNRPTPQPDAHDPTLFEQRTRSDISAPHPVFGSGGVALVGLAGKGREVVEPKAPEKPAFDEAPSVKQSAIPPAGNVTTAAGEGVPPTRNWARERTVSSPSPYVPPKPVERSPPPVITTGAPGVRGRVESLYAHANRSTERVPTTPVLRSSKSTDKITQPPAAPAKPEALRKPPPATNESPARVSPAPLSASVSTPPPRIQTPTSSTSQRATSVSPPVSTPSLVRPIQPQQRPLSTGPQIPQAKNLAPAFLKPAQPKDLTPSLSRLQGRGFVQSFVKLSSEIEAAASSGSPERPASATSPSPKRSVLDRWNPPTPSPKSSPISAPPLRKAKTFDTARNVQSDVSASPTPAPARESVRPTPQPKPASLSSAAKATPTKAKSVPAPGDVLPLGSSNTLISYIKPTKTGDAPVTDAQPAARSKTPNRHIDETTSSVDELGVRPKSRSSNSRSSSPTKPASRQKVDLASSPVPSGRPLNHPTKDRAKIRRRNASGQGSSEDSHLVQSAPALVGRQALEPSPEQIEVKRAVFPSQVAVATANPGTPPSSTLSSQQGQQSVAPTPPVRGENVRRLQDTWVNQAPISVKQVRKPPLATPSPTRTSFGAPQIALKASKQPLPGLAVAVENTQPAGSPPSPPLTPPLSLAARQERTKSPSSPMRHSRIPSTGSRATVMDVAQAFNDVTSPASPTAAPTSATDPLARSGEERNYERNPGGWGEPEDERTITPAMMKAERRRSNYEKYASFILPALPEEKTPVSSPVGTLKNAPDVSTLDRGVESEEKVEARVERPVQAEKPVPPKKPDFARVPLKVEIDVVDEPIPAINIAKIWDASPPRFVPDPDVHTVSVEVLNVEGGSATEVTKGTDSVFVFYDTETIAIVHRAKSRSSGLVTSKVWAWSGRKAQVGELEERKMQDLAKRYGTSLMRCGQCVEPQELVNVLGGFLVVRQGKRSLWSSENTTMHMVRSSAGLIVIDEVDLNVKNLCSGFSYCISLLDTLWVWYGCGSVAAERNAALRYAQTLLSKDSDKNLVEVEEGKEDEMFWMFLGDDGYASASYWKWRKSDKCGEPRFWKVDCANTGSEVKELETFPSPIDVSNSVLVIHLAYEIFALVGSAVRGQRRNIKLGLTLAQELSSHTARSKPFRPPVHVLIFPSQVPLDLQAAVRGLDADALHGSDDVPDHMNLLTLNDAWIQLKQKVWEQKDLEDTNMMPLGFTPS
ncbi:uncharacterized protein FOMMEDRAFT_156622 [Fomitiporia mediterranea MF3/22]|uniref:uncharacterized protein n=1 Tax=Fomitiporia mediterranea (strain MF3/22) TaxID=694068 RepID=UPI0004409328|nr:uncharacterized protein FOMMEDRAFT_156622 [Fomitiporia mediterranea MF3/22]EJD03235.1 hypothetical protein FOMMEDRAFT_156622 [Fomitiporia mediterranea MF3/22]